MVYFGPPKSDFILYEPGPGVGSTIWALGWRFPSKVPSKLNFWLNVYLGPSPIKDLYLYAPQFLVKLLKYKGGRFDLLIAHEGDFAEISFIS